jgi:hypothetical protein
MKMSIDARIAGVSIGPNGVFLNLEARDSRIGPAGQQRMEILNPPSPPTQLEVLVGECVWGGSGFLMLGDTKIADRVGCTQLRLLKGK